MWTNRKFRRAIKNLIKVMFDTKGYNKVLLSYLNEFKSESSNSKDEYKWKINNKL